MTAIKEIQDSMYGKIAKPQKGYIATTEAAERLGVSSARVRQLVANGELPATKFGPVNMIKESDVEKARNRPSVGRPSKKANKK